MDWRLLGSGGHRAIRIMNKGRILGRDMGDTVRIDSMRQTEALSTDGEMSSSSSGKGSESDASSW